MSFEDILGGKKKEVKKKKEEITDPKLIKYLSKSSIKQASRPDIVFLHRVEHKPSNTISLVIDGVVKKPAGDYLDVYKCNKCGNTFNHSRMNMLAGKPPHCPSCDK